MVPVTSWLTWGAGFVNTWTFPGPVDNPVPRKIVRGKSAESKSGEVDYWEDREDRELTLVVPLIPKTTAGSTTGYSAASGVQDALAWLQRGGLARLYFSAGVFKTVRAIDLDPDRDVERSQGGSRYTVKLRLRTTDGTSWTEY